MATLLVLVVRRLIGRRGRGLGGGLRDGQAGRQIGLGHRPEGLRERALFVLAIGLAFVGAGLLAGPGRHAVAVRRFLAPYLRDQPVAVYAVVAVLFLLWLAFIPGINNLGQVW